MIRAIRFGVLLGVRHAAHQLADYWVQTHHQAMTKAKPGSEGASACARHVATYTLTNLAAVAAANRLFGLGLSWRGIAAGETVSAVTHYAADRREHGALFKTAEAIGKGDYLRAGGAPDLDQSWHHTFNALAAGVAAVVD